MRWFVALLAALATAALTVVAPPAAAIPPPTPGAECNYPNCVPGIQPNVELGSYCDNPTYYAFGVTSWGRLVFCGSPRRYEPRWFRANQMHGIKLENDLCPGMEGSMAQAPDGLFLTCNARDGRTYWERGDL
jgi:hypothetical protein